MGHIFHEIPFMPETFACASPYPRIVSLIPYPFQFFLICYVHGCGDAYIAVIFTPYNFRQQFLIFHPFDRRSA